MHSGEKAGCVNSPDTVLRVRFPCNCHFYEKSEGFCQSLLPGRSCQESALRNRFLTEEEGGKKPKGSGVRPALRLVTERNSGKSLYISQIRALPPAFLSRPLRGHPLPGRGDYPAADAARSASSKRNPYFYMESIDNFLVRLYNVPGNL